MVTASDVRLAVGEIQARVGDADLPGFRDPVALRRLLRWFAEHETEPVNSSRLADVIGADASTVRRYVQRLEDSGVIFEVPAWRPGVMTRERKRTSYCFSSSVRLAAKIDAAPMSLGWFARQLRRVGGVGNYVQGQDIDTDLVYLPEVSPHEPEVDENESQQVALCPTISRISEAQNPVAMVVVDLADESQQETELATARSRANVISSFFFRTDVWVAVVGVWDADFAQETSCDSDPSRELELLVYQPCRHRVPPRLRTSRSR